MSNRQVDDTVAAVSLSSAGKQPATWWAGGLCLSERLPSSARSAGRASSRLARWRAAHGYDEEQFALRLAEVGLDQAGLDTLLSETPQELAARTGRPAWAAFVERATTTAAHAKYSPADDSWSESFAFVLRPLLAATAALDPRLDSEFVRTLAKRLVLIASRTLVLELNVARVRGTLTGDTPQERFADFTANLKLADLLADYPVLARLLGQACLHSADAHLELLDRFAADRAEIVATLLDDVDPGALVSVDAGQGDAHRRGRSVATLRFADGRQMIYKPRPIELHAHFNELLEWLDGHAGLGLRRVGLVRGEGYGWLEFIEQEPCVDAAGVRRFYHRLGALLALLYAVDGTDMHFENLIACGDQPLLIDIETLFHPVPAESKPDADPAAEAMARSVCNTALLPQMMLGDHGVIDVSGLGGDHGDIFPADTIVWKDGGTDQMRLIRRPSTATGAHNRPRLDGEPAEPADYVSALLAGFRVGYDTISTCREELLGPLGLLRRCANDEVRFVARPTRLYATVLEESTHPDALRDALDRDLALDLLWTESLDDTLLRSLVPHELADLWAGDVPLFTSRPGSRALWTADGLRLPGLLPLSGLAAAEHKIERMDEVNRHDQQWLITASLASRPGPVEHRSGDVLRGPLVTGVPDPQRLLIAACGIADEILAHAMTGENRVNWLGLELVDDRHWMVTPMGAGLSNGYTGVALFLAQLGKLTGADRYTDFALAALRPIPGLLERFAHDAELAAAVGTGFHGMGGISYALARLSALLHDHGDLPGWLDTAVDVTAGIGDTSSSVVDGLAGGLAAMLAVQAETGASKAGALARRQADRLVELPVVDHGFARGAAGVGWALLRYAAAGGEARHAIAGRAALRADHGLKQRLRDIGEADHSWCGGLSGAVLAHTAHPEQPIDAYTLHLDRCLNALAVREPLRDLSLCHGELGVTEALTVLAERGHDLAAATRTRRAGLVLGALEQYGARCGTPGGVPSAGLLTGLSGIGYGLLRLGFADQVPSVLLLHHR